MIALAISWYLIGMINSIANAIEYRSSHKRSRLRGISVAVLIVSSLGPMPLLAAYASRNKSVFEVDLSDDLIAEFRCLQAPK